MSEMIECVTRAICMPNHDHVAEPNACCGKCGLMIDKARAAIEAMRKPTEAMVKAGRGNVPYDRPAEDAWRDMIDEALK